MAKSEKGAILKEVHKDKSFYVYNFTLQNKIQGQKARKPLQKDMFEQKYLRSNHVCKFILKS